MNPADIRDQNFAALRDSLDRRRAEVYAAYVRFGPCTTRHLAELIGVEALSVRPRACELSQMGLLCMAGLSQKFVNGRRLTETIYRAATQDEWETWRAKHFTVGAQLQMAGV
jgi:hypothetical protein